MPIANKRNKIEIDMIQKTMRIMKILFGKGIITKHDYSQSNHKQESYEVEQKSLPKCFGTGKLYGKVA